MTIDLDRIPPALPKRACTMVLTIGADTRQAMAWSLRHLADEIDMGQINGPSGCSGGSESGYSYDCHFGTSPTHEEYFAAVRAWQESRASLAGLGGA